MGGDGEDLQLRKKKLEVWTQSSPTADDDKKLCMGTQQIFLFIIFESLFYHLTKLPQLELLIHILSFSIRQHRAATLILVSELYNSTQQEINFYFVKAQFNLYAKFCLPRLDRSRRNVT